MLIFLSSGNGSFRFSSIRTYHLLANPFYLDFFLQVYPQQASRRMHTLEWEGPGINSGGNLRKIGNHFSPLTAYPKKLEISMGDVS